MNSSEPHARKASISYLAMVNSGQSLGVKQKISNIVEAFTAINWQAEKQFFEMDGKKVYFHFAKALFFSKADVLVIRNSLAMPMFFWIILLKRLQGRFVIIDIPTPLTTWVQEILSSKLTWNFKLSRIVVLYLSFPWALYPANRILQYADESRFFKLGLSRKIKMVANGIGVDKINKRKNDQSLACGFVMIAVGSLAVWHGFDRVVRGMATHRRFHPESVPVRLFIVGEGEARLPWESLVADLGVADWVKFYGSRPGIELDELFDQAHVALASLGLYRKGLKMASDLKSREYCARGIPFVAAGDDLDFSPALSFVHKVPNTNDEVSIQKILDWYNELEPAQIAPDNIRSYAMKHLDFSVKVKSFVE
jgi:glycosyltransferase involved in cell wall biosynthesis